MTKENIKRLYDNFCKLSESGEYNFNNDFSNIPKGLTPERKALIKSDALNNKLILEEKFPWLLENEKPKEIKKDKSKSEVN